MPDQAPRRENGFYQRVLHQWSDTAVVAGLSEHETILLMCRFVGVAAAGFSGASPEEKVAVCDVFKSALDTAFAGKILTSSRRPGRQPYAERRPAG